MNIESDSKHSPDNVEHLREIKRTIASAIILSSDDYVLMGRKNPARGGVYPGVWHIPGGGVESGESLPKAAAREIAEEAGLEVEPEKLVTIPIIGTGETIKTLESGERVWCRMEFNRFELRLDIPAAELVDAVRPGDDLVELRWFSPEELREVEQIPGGREFFEEAGYIRE